VIALVRRRYGASPLHLLAHLVLLPLVAWAVLQVLSFRDAGNVVEWFVAALILHDLIGLPVYSALDHVAQATPRVRGVPVINHVRVVAVAAGVSLLVFFPLILGKSDGSLHYLSGVQPSGYFGRWLLLVALVAAASAAVLGVRVARADELNDSPVGTSDNEGPGG
jgi:Kef-type K+ transport system membrane component KefB